MMRRSLSTVLVLTALWGAGVWGLRAERVLIDFGPKDSPTPSPDAQGRHWNNAVGTGPGSMDENFHMDLVTTEGKASGIRLQVASAFKRSNTTKATQCPWYPAEAMDRWTGYSRAEGKPQPALLLNGLKMGLAYELIVYAINDLPEGGKGKARGQGMPFTAGGKTGRMNVANNVDQRLTLSDLRCEPDGTLLIKINEGGAAPGMISVLEIGYQSKPAGEKGKAKKGKAKSAPVRTQVAPVPSPAPAPAATPAPARVVPTEAAGSIGEAGEAEGAGGRGIIGGILLVLGLGVAGFVIWFNLRK